MAQKTITRTICFLVSFMMLVMLSFSAFAAIPAFSAYEGDVLYLSAETFDIDGDLVITRYPAPFDATGRWVTSYDDAGEYILTLVAEDSFGYEVSQDIRLTLLETNQEPYLSSDRLVFSEGDLIDLTTVLADPDNDVLRYSFGAPFDSETGLWQTDYLSAGRYVVDVLMDDGEFSLTQRIEVVVEDVNAAPQMIDIFEENGISFTVSEGELTDVYALFNDVDNDEISYEWYLDEELLSTDSSFDLRFDFDAGTDSYVLALVVRSVGFEERYEWKVFVNHVNRAPSMQDMTFVLSEGEELVLNLDSEDIDGDELSYSFSQFFDSEGRMIADYESAGEYEVIGVLSDGELSAEFIVSLIIEDTDRAPAIYGSPSYFADEGSMMSFSLEAEDFDGDAVVFEAASDLPEGAILSRSGLFTWNVPFDTVERRDGFFANVLNRLRIEQLFTSSREIPIRVKACGKELCSFATVDLVVWNVNRAPEIVSLYDQVITETDELVLDVEAVDPDGDIIEYIFEEPLDLKTGAWETSYEDEGAYFVTVTATDGFLYDTKTVAITVQKNNRGPWFTLKKDRYTVLEGEEVKFLVTATDLDPEDDLEITLVNGPQGSWFGADGTYSWVPSHDVVMNKTDSVVADIVGRVPFLNKRFGSEEESVWLEFMVSDGIDSAIMPVEIIVKNVNRAPQIDDLHPGLGDTLDVGFDDPIDFGVAASDADGDLLTYSWKFSGVDLRKLEGPNSISRVFSSSGSKKVSVRVCDGRECVMQEWTLDVVGDKPVVVESSVEESSSSEVIVQPEVQVVEKVVYVNNDDPAPTYGLYVVENWE